MTPAADKNQKMITYFLGFIVAVIIVAILILLRDLLIPITIAILLTYLFYPVLEFLKVKLKLPKPLGLIVILIFNFAVFYVLGLIFFSSFGDFSTRIEYYGEKLSQIVKDVLSPFDLTIMELEAFFGLEIQKFDAGKLLKQLFDAGIIQGFVSSFSNLLSNFFIVMIFWVFMILGKKRFEERLKVAYSSSSENIEKQIDAINDQLQSYLLIKTLVSLATGVSFTVVLTIYGIDFAMFWGLLAFILNYLPNIGSLLATVFPIIIALLDFGFGFTSISLAALLLIVQNIFGNVIEPKFLGMKLDLSPVFILISLIFWGWIWGIVGMFLAVPIASLFKILCSNINPLKPIAILIGTRAEQLESS
ncbi:MAG: AI-2E family transporter [Ignavibacteria bacterium]|jgi:predicted PurR-regulated permease PerM